MMSTPHPLQACFASPTRALLIAEIGVNHNGNVDLAEEMVRAAARSGADAVKFQNYRTEEFLSDHQLTYSYRNQGREVTESQYAMFKRCELTDVDLGRLKHCCDQQNVLFFTTPMSIEGLAAAMKVAPDLMKNGSDCIRHLSLIRHMARTGLPTILSTGMSNEDEIAQAVWAYREAGGQKLVLMACTSAYPTRVDEVHLRRIPELARRFSCAAGFSDHTAGWEAAVAAVCVGACMVEKHFTTDRGLPGPDQWFSSDPSEFRELAGRVRAAELMLGRSELRPAESEKWAREEYRLSCVAAVDLVAGHVLTETDIAFHRPGRGLPPAEVECLLGKAVRMPVARGGLLREKDVTQVRVV